MNSTWYYYVVCFYRAEGYPIKDNEKKFFFSIWGLSMWSLHSSKSQIIKKKYLYIYTHTYTYIHIMSYCDLCWEGDVALSYQVVSTGFHDFSDIWAEISKEGWKHELCCHRRRNIVRNGKQQELMLFQECQRGKCGWRQRM